ncbi:MAG: prepilin-type cleavage/methylation domain-containing protein [Gammaproteobacteria bacterium]|nr:prepilin-type cleavage/methylation domain-containing protein [Gammaproteobacteria bacterium]
MRPAGASPRARTGGFSLLELAVVTCLVAILATIGLYKIWELRVAAERAGVMHVVGSIRSALGIEIAHRVAESRVGTIPELDGTNPMDLLAQRPRTYIGEHADPTPGRIAPGRWYFDATAGALVYRVRFEQAVETTLTGPKRLRFEVAVVYGDRDRNGRFDPARDEVYGADLVALEPYAWKGEEKRPNLAPSLQK